VRSPVGVWAPRDAMLASRVVWQKVELCGLPTFSWGHADPAAPVVVFLHGIGERGDDGLAAVSLGLPRVVAQGLATAFRVVVPQCPVTRRWTECIDELRALFDGIPSLWPEAPAQSVLTGFSMGGQGVWAFAARHPARIARIAPVAARIPPDLTAAEIAGALRSMPTWVVHGALDRQVPVANSDSMVAALRAQGAAPTYTRYLTADHIGACERAYGDPTFRAWLVA
jgi:predicted peptidase